MGWSTKTAVAALLFGVLSVGGWRASRADDDVPAGVDLPRFLGLDDALRIWRAHGLDLLLAEAAVKSSEGAVLIAGAIQNPVATATVANAFTYQWSKSSNFDCNSFGAVCTPWGYTFGLNDSAAIEDALSGKRDLRLKVARNALAAAKMSRVDATRTIGLQVKSAYVQVAQAQLAYRFAKDVAASEVTTLKKFQDRYKAGAVSEGDLERIEVTKLEADQAVDGALSTLRQARAALAFLLGVRGDVPEFDVDAKALDYVAPAQLRGVTPVALVHTAFDKRPDLQSLAYTRASADGQLQLVRRQKFPDITLGLTYQWGGAAGWSVDLAIVGPMLTLSLSAPLPVFYQLQGEERQAEAQREIATLQQAKQTAQVANDVATGYAGLDASMKLVERMEGPRRSEGGLLESAKGAFDIVAAQYDKGVASLTDYLDALRTYIATKNEYIGDLANYWTSVFQLEAATGRDLAMKSRDGIVFFFLLALVLLASACEPVSVAPWPYTTVDAARADGGASNDGASNDASGQGASGAGGIQANYPPAPLRCDGGLCDTDNYSLCAVADKPAGRGAGTAFSMLVVVAAMAVARKRNREKARRRW